MEIYGKTDIGKKRHSNQDAFITGKLADDAAFAIVCDGMGGANAGNVASRNGAEAIADYILNSYRSDADSFTLERILKNAIESANMMIYDMSLKDTDLSGMGTTVVATIIKGDTAIIAHVGDSRAYLANNELRQLTRDHSVVQTLVETGKISPEDAKVHPRKNVITRALGVEENIISDCCEIPFDDGDTLLLCTDGLTGYSDEKDILKIIKKSNTESACDKLVELANSGGGGDNITVVTLTK